MRRITRFIFSFIFGWSSVAFSQLKDVNDNLPKSIEISATTSPDRMSRSDLMLTNSNIDIEKLSLQNGYAIPKAESRDVKAHNDNYIITDLCAQGSGAFIPSRTEVEWKVFVANHPRCIILNNVAPLQQPAGMTSTTASDETCAYIQGPNGSKYDISNSTNADFVGRCGSSLCSGYAFVDNCSTTNTVTTTIPNQGCATADGQMICGTGNGGQSAASSSSTSSSSGGDD